jgi:cytochrome o ubiquinol oxidase subunit 2
MLIAVIPVYFFLFFFVWKYRAGKAGANYSPDMRSNFGIGFILWAIPAAIIGIIGIINWKSTHALDPYNPIASDAKPLTIEVIALPWKFLFIYPKQNIATVNFIEFPVNTPLNFELTADAPMSSFWIPQLGSQIYAMAAMSTQLHLIANTVGDFKGMDTEINGAGFSGMKFIARSATQADFNSWVKGVESSPNALSANVYNQLAAPSENNPPAYYAPVEANLYNTVMMKFMAPAPEMQNAVVGSSPPMAMPGMDMK